MNFRENKYFILIFITLFGIFFLFLLETGIWKKAISKTDDSSQSEYPLSESHLLTQDIKPNTYTEVIDSQIDSMNSHHRSWSGLLLTQEKLIIYTPERGQIKLNVEVNDQIKRGDIIGEVSISSSKEEPLMQQRTVLSEEVTIKERDITIALEDIENINQQIDSLKDRLHESEYDEQRMVLGEELIDKNKSEQRKDQSAQLRMNLDEAEAMLEKKYHDIDEYEERIRELKTTVSKLTDRITIKAPFDAIVSNILFVSDYKRESSYDIDKDVPILELATPNLLSIQIEEELPFSLDKKQVKIAIGEDVQEYTGTVMIESFISHDTNKKKRTLVKVVLDQNINGSIHKPGERIKLFL